MTYKTTMEYDDDAIRYNLRTTELNNDYYKHIYIYDISKIYMLGIGVYNNGELCKLFNIQYEEVEYINKDLLYLFLDICLDEYIFQTNLDYPLDILDYMESTIMRSYEITDYLIDSIRVYLSRFRSAILTILNNTIDPKYNINSVMNTDIVFYHNYFRIENIDLDHDINYIVIEKYFYYK